MLGRENLVPLDNPIGQLQMLAAEVVKWQEILGTKVEGLSSWQHQDISGREDVRAIILAYERAMDRTGKILVDMARLGIEERLAKVTEAQAQTLIALIVAVLASEEPGLSKELRAVGRRIVARAVAAVRGAGPVIGVSEYASS